MAKKRYRVTGKFFTSDGRYIDPAREKEPVYLFLDDEEAKSASLKLDEPAAAEVSPIPLGDGPPDGDGPADSDGPRLSLNPQVPPPAGDAGTAAGPAQVEPPKTDAPPAGGDATSKKK